MEFPPFVDGLWKVEVLGVTGLIPQAFEQQVKENGITVEFSETFEYKANTDQVGCHVNLLD